jgi:hypothetical protein
MAIATIHFDDGSTLTFGDVSMEQAVQISYVLVNNRYEIGD